MIARTTSSRRQLGAAAVLLAVSFTIALAGPAGAQRPGTGTVTGVVRDSTGMAIAGARVMVQGASLATLTNEQGAFRLTSVPSGTVGIEVRRLGFTPAAGSYELKRGATIRVELLVTAVPHALSAVHIRGARGQADRAFGGFYRRREHGMGRFLAREDIERRNAQMTTDLFRMVPGVNVVQTRSMRRVLRLRGSNCSPLIWMDGVPLWSGQEFDFDAISPRSIEGIEVYSMANLPPQFRSAAGTIDCGVIVVWTRRGEPRARRRPAGRAAAEVAEQVRERTIYTADRVDEPVQRLEEHPLVAEYPPALYVQRISGSAVVEFVVDTLGRMDESTFNVISATHPAFSESVRSALTKARFSPARLEGRLVPQVVQLPFYFVMSESQAARPEGR